MSSSNSLRRDALSLPALRDRSTNIAIESQRDALVERLFGRDPRRVRREWQEQQAVTGILEVSDGRFSLPAGHDEALIDETSLAFAAPFARFAAAVARPLPELVEAGDDVERLYYGFSVLHCLPVGMPGAGTGAVMRVDTVRSYALDAGFGEVDVLPIDNDFWRFYRLSV